MKRRQFITLLGGAAAAAWPRAARAQPPERVRRIGILMAGADDADGQARVAAFRQGLRELGWQEGRNLAIDNRWGGGGNEQIRTVAAELVGSKPDLILVNGNRGLAALQQASGSIPIVFAGLSDPVENGFVASLARPGGNITGFANSELSMHGKQLGLLKQIAPQVVRVAFVTVSGLISDARSFAATNPHPGIKLEIMAVNGAAEIERAITAFAHEPGGGLLVSGGATTIVHRDLIIALAARHRLPAVYFFRVMAVSGGLSYYGADIIDLTRQAASYADRILKGEKAGDLPVQFATKFELVINLRTAKALGLDVPATLLALADEVIE